MDIQNWLLFKNLCCCQFDQLVNDVFHVHLFHPGQVMLFAMSQVQHWNENVNVGDDDVIDEDGDDDDGKSNLNGKDWTEKFKEKRKPDHQALQ